MKLSVTAKNIIITFRVGLLLFYSTLLMFWDSNMESFSALHLVDYFVVEHVISEDLFLFAIQSLSLLNKKTKY